MNTINSDAFFKIMLLILSIGTPQLSAWEKTEILFKSGDTVAFLGDSITQHGFENKPLGYVNLVADGLRENGIDITVIPAGISGETSVQMLARLDRDVIRKKPQWMFLSCGVNDAPNGIDNPGVPLEKYQENITAILDRCQAEGIKVFILTATMVLEDPAHISNKNLEAYNAFLRKIAAERSLPLADLNTRMQQAVARKDDLKSLYFTVDGTHMSGRGNILMASGILGALNVPEEKVVTCIKRWMNFPDGVSNKLTVQFSQQEQDLLESVLQKNQTDLKTVVKQLLLEYTAENQKTDSGK